MYYNDLESDATMEALNWALDMLDKYEMVYPEDAAWDYTYTAFANGEAVFTCEEAYRAGDWSGEDGMEDEFGFVCFPMGPRMDHYVNYAKDNVLSFRPAMMKIRHGNSHLHITFTQIRFRGMRTTKHGKWII